MVNAMKGAWQRLDLGLQWHGRMVNNITVSTAVNQVLINEH